jgi:hypothetical protein
MLKGIDFSGFLTSPPVVDIESKPINAMKHLAVPLSVPEIPNGKKPPVPHVSIESHVAFVVL